MDGVFPLGKIGTANRDLYQMVCLCWIAGARHSSFFNAFFVIGALLALITTPPQRAKLTHLITSCYSLTNTNGFHLDHRLLPTFRGTTIAVLEASFR